MAALRQASPEALLEDYAKQIHRNAHIAKDKFAAVRAAMITLFAAIIPWLSGVALLYNG